MRMIRRQIFGGCESLRSADGSFPEDVKTQLLSVPESVSPEETEGRRDLRDRMTVTIDGEDAKDLDDAITLEMKDGHYFWACILQM